MKILKFIEYIKENSNLKNLKPSHKMTDWYRENKNLFHNDVLFDKFIQNFNDDLLEYTWFDILFIWAILLDLKV
jgi:hypothetical protein